jgi:hypothetical protein
MNHILTKLLEEVKVFLETDDDDLAARFIFKTMLGAMVDFGQLPEDTRRVVINYLKIGAES